MTAPSPAAHLLAIAKQALQTIYEESDDADSRHAAEHALVKMKRIEAQSQGEEQGRV